MALPPLSTLLVVAARVTLILGLLVAGKIGMEWVQTRALPYPRAYVLILGVESFIAAVGAIGAVGILRPKPWGLPVLTFAAAAGFVDACAGVFVLRHHLTDLTLFVGPDPIGVAYGLRILMTIIQALWWPILLVLIFIEIQGWDPDAPYTRISKRLFWAVGATTTAAVGGVELLMR